MSAFQGTGLSRGGRPFTFAGEVTPEEHGYRWSAEVSDRPGRAPMRMGGHLDSIFAPHPTIEAAMVAWLTSEIAKRRL